MVKHLKYFKQQIDSMWHETAEAVLPKTGLLSAEIILSDQP